MTQFIAADQNVMPIQTVPHDRDVMICICLDEDDIITEYAVKAHMTPDGWVTTDTNELITDEPYGWINIESVH